MNEAERTNETASITATILEEEEARKALLDDKEDEDDELDFDY